MTPTRAPYPANVFGGDAPRRDASRESEAGRAHTERTATPASRPASPHRRSRAVPARARARSEHAPLSSERFASILSVRRPLDITRPSCTPPRAAGSFHVRLVEGTVSGGRAHVTRDTCAAPARSSTIHEVGRGEQHGAQQQSGALQVRRMLRHERPHSEQRDAAGEKEPEWRMSFARGRGGAEAARANDERKEHDAPSVRGLRSSPRGNMGYAVRRSGSAMQCSAQATEATHPTMSSRPLGADDEAGRAVTWAKESERTEVQ
jgi:hypothetical protein